MIFRWAMVPAIVLLTDQATAHLTPFIRMTALITTLFLAMKGVVLAAERLRGIELAGLRRIAFCVGWPGMRPTVFQSAFGPSLPGAEPLVRDGTRFFAAGLALFLAAAATATWVRAAYPHPAHRLWQTILVLVGCSLMLHFGLFNLVAAGWRRLGADCRPLFRSPWRSRSLGEFWSRRWNLAFSEMTSLAVYRPLEPRVGPTWALLASFAASGMLHEVAISVPVRAGFGLPLGYFLIHGMLVLAEQHLARRGHPIERLGWISRVWVAAWLILPLPILFHPPFLRGVVWPLFEP